MPGWTSSSGGGRGDSLENRPAQYKKDDAQRAVAVVARTVIALMFAARLLGTCGQNCTAGRANHK